MKRWIFRILLILVTCFAVIAVINREMIMLFVKGGELSGKMEAIPRPMAALPPLESGENDWLSWRGQDDSGISPLKGIRRDWSKGLEKLWEINYLCQNSATATWGAPVVKGNRLIVTGRDEKHDYLFCLQSETGELIWKYSYESDAKSGWGQGSRATPCIDGEFVYSFGRSGDVCCIKLYDGTPVWKVNVETIGGKSPEWGHSSSPLVLGDKVIVQCGGEIRTAAFDKNTGKLVWKSGSGVAGYAAVSFMKTGSGTLLLVFHGSGLSGIDADSGKEAWSIPWKTPYDVHATTPVASEKGIFISSGYDIGCALVTVENGKASYKWKNDAIASHHSDPYIIGNYIYGYSGQSTQNSGKFKCVELDTGREMWSTGQLGWGTCLLIDDHLICQDIKGNLFLVRPDPEKLVLVSSFPEALGRVNGPVWTIPVTAADRIYLRVKQRLICYRIK